MTGAFLWSRARQGGPIAKIAVGRLRALDGKNFVSAKRAEGLSAQAVGRRVLHPGTVEVL